jgi:oligopeptidase A
MKNDNPLLQKYTLPPFDKIMVRHIEPAINYMIDENRKELKDIIKNTKNYTWKNFFQKIENMEDRLQRVWSPVSHLHSVADNNELRKAYNNCLTKLSNYSTEMGQNIDLFKTYDIFSKKSSFKNLSKSQKKIINNSIRDFRLSGIDLNIESKKIYKKIQNKLSELQTKFEENLLDATHAWKKHITDKNELSGIPDSVIALASETAKKENKEGWLFTLEAPFYIPVMKYADSSALRKEMYWAYTTRASEIGPNAGEFDNTKIMYDILEYRTKKSELLGFKNFANYSLETKMAKSTDEVLNFLTNLVDRTKKYAINEFEELEEFTSRLSGINNLKAYDILYYSEKLKQKKFSISQEELRRYFPIKQVINGLFSITKKLYDIEIRKRSGVQVWNNDVEFFDILDNKGIIIASFFLDLFSRQHKRGGAWMDECIVRKKINSKIQNPVAYLTCNFTPPIDDKPTLLTHDEVITLFHEFGHGLHHMMTKIDYCGVSGINGVPWDAVELPSQFMENFCWEKEALDLFARDFETGKTIDNGLFKKMTKARSFQMAMQMIRQLEYAIFDFRLHLEYASRKDLDIQILLDEVRKYVTVVETPEFNRFQHSFSHIFAGGYAAGYYSYKWAEVLSADAFSKFEEKGIFNKITGKEFLKTILEKGGSCEPMEMFVEFRGREPSIEPLLKHIGITN